MIMILGIISTETRTSAMALGTMAWRSVAAPASGTTRGVGRKKNARSQEGGPIR